MATDLFEFGRVVAPTLAEERLTPSVGGDGACVLHWPEVSEVEVGLAPLDLIDRDMIFAPLSGLTAVGGFACALEAFDERMALHARGGTFDVRGLNASLVYRFRLGTFNQADFNERANQ